MNSENFHQQYESLIHGSGAIPLSEWTKLDIRGEDRTSFLHNMCTNDIHRLQPGNGCEIFLTDVKGHVIAHAFLLVDEDSVRLITVPNQASRIIKHLDRYIIREDVVLADESASVAMLLVCGKQSAVKLDAATGGIASRLVEEWQHSAAMLDDVSVQIVRTAWLHVPSYLMLIPATRQADMYRGLETVGVDQCDAEFWNAIRIESGLPLWGVDFDDSHLPQEIARNEQAISFNKGCYLGQETIARIDALGHVNKQLVMVKFSSQEIPNVEAELRSADELVGVVTSSCWSPHLDCPLALAMVRRGSNGAGCRLQTGYGDAEVMEAPAEAV